MKKIFITLAAFFLMVAPVTAQKQYQSMFIVGKDGQTVYSGGTIFRVPAIPNKCDPCLVTAAHVIDSSGLTLRFSVGTETLDIDKATTIPVEVLKVSNKYDLALCTPLSKAELPLDAITLASGVLQSEEQIYCSGATWLDVGDWDFSQLHVTANTTSTGIYSRTVDLSPIIPTIGANWNQMFYHTTTAIGGFSGSPILNKSGELVGVEVGSIGGLINIGVRLEDIKDFLNNEVYASEAVALTTPKALIPCEMTKAYFSRCATKKR